VWSAERPTPGRVNALTGTECKDTMQQGMWSRASLGLTDQSTLAAEAPA
jgi:hypothetical protein